MPTQTFVYGYFTLQVDVPNARLLNMQEYDGGTRVSFDLGANVMIDFELRVVSERPLTQLDYRILENGRVIFTATGGFGETRRHTGARSSGPVAEMRVYNF